MYGSKDKVFSTIPMLNTKSLLFMKRIQPQMETKEMRMISERALHKFYEVRTIEEHSSGINQMLRMNKDTVVTVSDDCTMKFWNSRTLKVEETHQTETITCIDATGPLQHLLVAGCHSGNFLVVKSRILGRNIQKETTENAHHNLIRVITSLRTLNDKYFVSADVCGFVKVWYSDLKPKKMLEFQLDGAISYNSVVEMQDYLPTSSPFLDATLIAVGLKTLKVELVVLFPARGQFQRLKCLQTSQKPTCLVQLSSRHLAVAVGSLQEAASIEIHDI